MEAAPFSAFALSLSRLILMGLMAPNFAILYLLGFNPAMSQADMARKAPPK
jgi:hypothetical protein